MLLIFSSVLVVLLFVKQNLGDIGKTRSNNNNEFCRPPTNKNAISSCASKNNLEYPISSSELDVLRKESLSVSTQSCPSDKSRVCLNIDRQSLIGSGTYGLVVRGRSTTVNFPLAIKFIKVPSKLDIVSFNTMGRYARIDPVSLAKNTGSERGLREVVALRLLTEAEVPSIPKYVAYLETSSYKILAMELLQGYEELSMIIDRLSARDLLVISCQTAAIVCNLDTLGVAHDDMHERNVLVDRRNGNKVNIIDFGGAQFSGQRGHFTSTSNFLKQPVNLLGHLKRILKGELIDSIQSQEKKEKGRFCAMMQRMTTARNDDEKEMVPYAYRILFEKHWKIVQTKKKLFKCAL